MAAAGQPDILPVSSRLPRDAAQERQWVEAAPPFMTQLRKPFSITSATFSWSRQLQRSSQTEEERSQPAIPFLGIYPDKTLIQKDTYTPVLIAALFTIARTWKQPKCPPTNEWIKKMWYIHTMEYYSAIKKNEIMPFEATWMDLEMTILTEVSHTEKNKTICYHLCGI